MTATGLTGRAAPPALPAHRHDLAAHLATHGPLPALDLTTTAGRDRFLATVAEADLRGRGGGGFPAARKLAAVAAAHPGKPGRPGRPGRAVVVANGCEGDTFSRKDRALLTLAPHLVLDGIALAAATVGATEAILAVHQSSPITRTLNAALDERTDPVPTRLANVPNRFAASEETALVHYLSTDDARPTGKHPRPAQSGVRGRPTLVSNVDTLAQLAILARIGATAYHAHRSDLVTVTGTVHRPGVHEVPAATTIATLLQHAGNPTRPVHAVLTGGHGGQWLPWPHAAHQPLPTGIPAVHVLPDDLCGLAFTARMLTYLAGESARQCGPCMFGLPAIATDFAALRRGDTTALPRLQRRLPVITGRGGCAHPDGAVRLAASALHTFHADIDAHLRHRRCTASRPR